MEIFLWSYLKNKVYYERFEHVNVLRQKIENEIILLNRDQSDCVFNTIKSKLRKTFTNGRENGYVENSFRCVKFILNQKRFVFQEHVLHYYLIVF